MSLARDVDLPFTANESGLSGIKTLFDVSLFRLINFSHLEQVQEMPYLMS